MIFNLPLGKAYFTVVLCGYPNETITLTGANTGTVTLDSSGKYTYNDWRIGSTTVVGSSSSSVFPARTVTVTSDCNVCMWPDNVDMIYWHGYETVASTGSTGGYGQTHSASWTVNTNTLYARVDCTSGNAATGSYADAQASATRTFSGARSGGTLHYDVSFTGGSNAYAGTNHSVSHSEETVTVYVDVWTHSPNQERYSNSGSCTIRYIYIEH